MCVCPLLWPKQIMTAYNTKASFPPILHNKHIYFRNKIGRMNGHACLRLK